MAGARDIHFRVPGKVMLAGEYAVLAGMPGIVCAVDRYLSISALEAPVDSIEGAGARFRQGEAEPVGLKFAVQSLRLAWLYLEGRGIRSTHLAMTLQDDLRAPTGEKLGLGGSACASVAVVAAVLESAGLADKERVFKIAASAHAASQERPGSGLDVAASVFGGTLWTWRFEAEPLIAASRGSPLGFAAAVDRLRLPDREQLPEPPGLLLAFSGRSAGTGPLIAKVEALRAREPGGFAEFLACSAAGADQLRHALLAKDLSSIRAVVETLQQLLRRLGELAGVELVTSAHRDIERMARESGAAAKISGAGGGDCSVALGDPVSASSLESRLQAAGVLALRPRIAAGLERLS